MSSQDGFNKAIAAYSLDIHKRIVDAAERGVATSSESTSLFCVQESFVYKLLRQRCQCRNIAPLLHSGGAEAKLNKDHLMILTYPVAQAPDVTLKELRAQIKKQARVEVSVPTIWDALGLSRKKVSSGSRSRSR